MSAHPEKSILVYDIGGSHVSAAACTGAGYRLGDIVSAAHPVEQTSDAFLDVIYSLGVRAAVGCDGVCGAELAMPGPFDFKSGVSRMRHKLPYLYGIDLRGSLAQRFGWEQEQIRFLHDSAAFLLGEIGAGAARGVMRTVGITLGTGIGSAFAVDGRLVTGGTGVPADGEIWNLPFGEGILEDAVSTRAIQRSYESRTGVLRDVGRIAEGAAKDPIAAAVFAEFGRQLGLALRMALAEFKPEIVVLGGGIARSSRLFLAKAQDQISDLQFNLQVSALRDRAPLVGAAVAWFNECSGADGHGRLSIPGASHADAI